MAEERRKIEIILRKLKNEEREDLAKIPPDEMRTLVFDLVHIPPFALTGYIKQVQKQKLKTAEDYVLKEALKVRDIRELLTVRAPQYLFKLSREEIKEIGRTASFFPELLKIPVPPPPAAVPKVPTPPVAVPVPTEEEIKARIVKVKEITPKRWRSHLFPFKTADFVKKILIMRGKEGAYPYEIWKVMVNALIGIYESAEIRAMMTAIKGIPVDGLIDSELVEGMPAIKKLGEKERIRASIYHIPLYSSIRKYFYVLTKLGLIKRIDKRAPPMRTRIIKELEELGIEPKVEKTYDFVKSNFWRQYYIATPAKLGSVMWERPLTFYNPLSTLGKRGYRDLEVSLAEIRIEEPEMTLKDLFYEENKEWIKSLAKIRGVSVKEILKI